jgi:hypothetical protein
VRMGCRSGGRRRRGSRVNRQVLRGGVFLSYGSPSTQRREHLVVRTITRTVSRTPLFDYRCVVALVQGLVHPTTHKRAHNVARQPLEPCGHPRTTPPPHSHVGQLDLCNSITHQSNDIFHESYMALSSMPHQQKRDLLLDTFLTPWS